MAVRCAVLETRCSTTGTSPRGVPLRAADPLKIPIDPNGNLASKTEGTDNWTYPWTAENQLTQVVKDGAAVARFSYDALGRRVEKRRSRGRALPLRRRGHRRGAAGGPSSYIHGPGWTSRSLARTGQLDHGLLPRRWLGLSSPTDAPEPLRVAAATTLGEPRDRRDQPGYAFTGREWDPETGLYYYRARYYDPKSGGSSVKIRSVSQARRISTRTRLRIRSVWRIHRGWMGSAHRWAVRRPRVWSRGASRLRRRL